MLSSPRFRYALYSFAAASGVAPAKVSHLASVVLAVVVKKARIIQQHFPEMMFDPAISAVVQKRAQREQ